jgi:hypothetical protein
VLAGKTLKPTTRRLVLIAALIFVVSTVGLVLAVVFQWPTQFDGSGNPNVTAGEVVTGGTATSIPLGPWVALAVFAFLARSRRWWRTLGVVGLCLLAVVTLIGSLGEAFASSTPDLPRVALVAPGVVDVVLCPVLLLSGAAESIDGARARLQPSRVS